MRRVQQPIAVERPVLWNVEPEPAVAGHVRQLQRVQRRLGPAEHAGENRDLLPRPQALADARRTVEPRVHREIDRRDPLVRGVHEMMNSAPDRLAARALASSPPCDEVIVNSGTTTTSSPSSAFAAASNSRAASTGTALVATA